MDSSIEFGADSSNTWYCTLEWGVVSNKIGPDIPASIFRVEREIKMSQPISILWYTCSRNIITGAWCHTLCKWKITKSTAQGKCSLKANL